ncbi:unnamed protein product [Paramecium sonneborni]|uniref:Uncharacterized protein n=1 Tax=Paramecium sonneborni TaxID=65129 RepID=A0A8S1QTX5_9CILI|nr:unnamed protein product [Paramecium sonneborni]
MISDAIYLDEKITHSLLVVHLYILRLPQKLSDYQELNEIIRKKEIKVIFNVGTSALQKIQVEKLQNLSEENKIEETVNKIHQELIINKSNIGLICSESCQKSLQIYFHYMVMIEQTEFEKIQLQLFKHVFSQKELKSMYDEIKRNQNLLSFNLFNTNSQIDYKLSNISSAIINIEQRKSNVINPSITSANQHRIFNGHQVPTFTNESRMRILGKEDQIESKIEELGFILPPFQSLQDSQVINEQINNIQTNPQIIQQTNPQTIQQLNPQIHLETIPQKNPQIIISQQNPQNLDYKNTPTAREQHSLKFENEYKLPQSITFIHFIPSEGFKCLE